MEDSVSLGGNIELSGFRDIDPGSMVILKKIVGNFAKKFSDQNEDFQKLHVTMKPLHEREKGEIYEIHGRLMVNGSSFSAEMVDRNLFYCLDKVMKKLESEIE
ncbi:hypothetical protein HYV81_02470 [Candidatus Woesearchaeota archaeon]|nr:hypothetical protein [Candidatus Woesearchaeota archaeon]